MELHYSDQYSLSDFADIDEVSSKKRYGQKSIDTTALIILFFAYKLIEWFSQGYFTRLGELTAEGHSKRYDSFKSKITKALFKRKHPTCGITFMYNDCLVRVFYKPSDESHFSMQLDYTKELYDKLLALIDSGKYNMKMLTVSLKDSEITECFYVDNNDDMFTLENLAVAKE